MCYSPSSSSSFSLAGLGGGWWGRGDRLASCWGGGGGGSGVSVVFLVTGGGRLRGAGFGAATGGGAIPFRAV